MRSRTSTSSGRVVGQVRGVHLGEPAAGDHGPASLGQPAVLAGVERDELGAGRGQRLEVVLVHEAEGPARGERDTNRRARRRQRGIVDPAAPARWPRAARRRRGRSRVPRRERADRVRPGRRRDARRPGRDRGGGPARRTRRLGRGRRATARRSTRARRGGSRAWRAELTRLQITPATSTRRSRVAKPCTVAAMDCPSPAASTTRTIGASSSTATSAVEEGAPSRAPSKRPMTPSTTSRSAPGAARPASGPIAAGPAHPRVEVPAGSSGGQRVVAGVDEVGSDLRGRHPPPPPGERGHEAAGDGGLADPRVRAGDHQPRPERGGHRRLVLDALAGADPLVRRVLDLDHLGHRVGQLDDLVGRRSGPSPRRWSAAGGARGPPRCRRPAPSRTSPCRSPRRGSPGRSRRWRSWPPPRPRRGGPWRRSRPGRSTPR